jgi:hypothetical protein
VDVTFRRLLLGSALVTLLSACSYTPSALEDWPETPSCGEWVNRNEEASADQRRKNRCFLDAFEEGREAELYVTFHTVEGDPIREYFRVVGPGQVEAFIDSTDDEFGTQEWTHYICEGISDSEGFGFLAGEDCRELAVEQTVSGTE